MMKKIHNPDESLSVEVDGRVRHICLSCGSDHGPNYFARHIKSCLGMTPTQYYVHYFLEESVKCSVPDCNNEVELRRFVHGEFYSTCSEECSIRIRSVNTSKQWEDPEYSKMMREVASQTLKETWRRDYEKMREKNRSNVKKLWEDPEFRKRHSERCSKVFKKLWETEEFRAMVSERSARILSEMWKDPEYSEQRRESLSEQSSSMNRDPNSNWGNHLRYPYKGHVFKSSWELEFFQLCEEFEVEVIYEPVTVNLGLSYRKCYTPDFYLPEFGVDIEVKPRVFHEENKELLKVFREKTGYPIVILDRDDFIPFLTSIILDTTR